MKDKINNYIAENERQVKHPKCLGEKDYWGYFYCGYQSVLMCEDCKYGLGKKDPEAKCNQ